MTNINAANTAADHLTLESVQEAFNHWRDIRGSEKRIPDYLWQQISAIFPHYRQSKILSTLKLNHAQLHKNLNLPTRPRPPLKRILANKQKKNPPASPFVKAFLPTPAEHSYQVEWQKSDGSKLMITHLNAAGLSVLIQNWRI